MSETRYVQLSPWTTRYIARAQVSLKKRLKTEKTRERKRWEKANSAAREERRRKHEELLGTHRRKRERRRAMVVEFGTMMKKKREALGVSVERLAAITGVPLSTLIKVEACEGCLYFDTAARLAQLLKINLLPIIEMADADEWKAELAEEVKRHAETVDQEMAAVEKRLQELRDRKNLMTRITRSE